MKLRDEFLQRIPTKNSPEKVNEGYCQKYKCNCYNCASNETEVGEIGVALSCEECDDQKETTERKEDKNWIVSNVFHLSCGRPRPIVGGN